jgi:hypothetical protein
MWKVEDGRWQVPNVIARRGDLANQNIPGLEVLSGDAHIYTQWAAESIGRTISIRAVRALFEFTPLSPAIAADLGACRPFCDIAIDARAIGYPVENV